MKKLAILLKCEFKSEYQKATFVDIIETAVKAMNSGTASPLASKYNKITMVISEDDRGCYIGHDLPMGVQK